MDQGQDMGLLATINDTYSATEIDSVKLITEFIAPSPITNSTIAALLNNLVALYSGADSQSPIGVFSSMDTIGSVDFSGNTAGFIPGRVRFGSKVRVEGDYGVGNGGNSDWSPQQPADTVMIALSITAVFFLALFVWYILKKRRQVGAWIKTQTNNNNGDIDHNSNPPGGGLAAALELSNRTTESLSAPPEYTRHEIVQPIGLSSHPRPTVATAIGDQTM